ncbi:MAG: hypothetical protein CMI31_10695 [Opitutae bacterium]|nr:hypothetical protein [Opitutae bacterium]
MKLIAFIVFPLFGWALQVDDNSSSVASESEPPTSDNNLTIVGDGVASDEESNASEENASSTEDAATEKENEGDTLKESIGGDSGGLGIQRLVEVKDSAITVSASYSTRYYYSSNPEKVKVPTKKDITLWENGLSVNIGLGQLALMDRLVTPSLMAMHMRIWTDPGKDYGNYFRLFDVDSQSATLSFNVELFEGWSMNLGYGKSRAIDFRNDKVSVYTDTPTLAFSKMIPFGDADMLMINLGTAYNFNKATAEVNIPALDLLIPSDGSDSWGTNLNVNYMMPWEGIEKLSLSPSFGLSHSYYTNETAKPIASKGRQDWTLNYGLNATYQLTETIGIQAFGMYSKKTFNSYALDSLGLRATEYKNFDAGLSISASYNF